MTESVTASKGSKCNVETNFILLKRALNRPLNQEISLSQNIKIYWLVSVCLCHKDKCVIILFLQISYFYYSATNNKTLFIKFNLPGRAYNFILKSTTKNKNIVISKSSKILIKLIFRPHIPNIPGSPTYS